MSFLDRQRFDRRATDACLRVLGGALIACALSDLLGGAWRVHAGELFPWRHLPGIPLAGRGALSVELLLGGIAGALLLARARRRLGLGLGLAATVIGLSQRFSNHRALLLIVLAFIALSMPDPADPGFEQRAQPNLALVRAQLVLVYGFSALNKLLHGFASGAALGSLFGWPAPIAMPAAVLVIVAEVAAPALLVTRPRLGVVVVAALHLAMALLLPSVLPFSLTMVAMALLFVRPQIALSETGTE